MNSPAFGPFGALATQVLAAGTREGELLAWSTRAPACCGRRGPWPREHHDLWNTRRSVARPARPACAALRHRLESPRRGQRSELDRASQSTQLVNRVRMAARPPAVARRRRPVHRRRGAVHPRARDRRARRARAMGRAPSGARQPPHPAPDDAAAAARVSADEVHGTAPLVLHVAKTGGGGTYVDLVGEYEDEYVRTRRRVEVPPPAAGSDLEPERGGALEQHRPLALVLRQRRGSLELGARLVGTPEPRQQVARGRSAAGGSRSARRSRRARRRARARPRGPNAIADRDRAVELDHRRGRELRERVV